MCRVPPTCHGRCPSARVCPWGKAAGGLLHLVRDELRSLLRDALEYLRGRDAHLEVLVQVPRELSGEPTFILLQLALRWDLQALLELEGRDICRVGAARGASVAPSEGAGAGIPPPFSGAPPLGPAPPRTSRQVRACVERRGARAAPFGSARARGGLPPGAGLT